VKLGVCTPTLFHYIYHHVQSCGVRSSGGGGYTPPISTLPLYVLCAPQYKPQIYCTATPTPSQLEPVFLVQQYSSVHKMLFLYVVLSFLPMKM
jgi:hypothetical protein